jgi:hypothetical protein
MEAEGRHEDTTIVNFHYEVGKLYVQKENKNEKKCIGVMDMKMIMSP